MIDNYVGARRSEPLHAPAQQHEGVEDTAENKVLPGVAAVSSDPQQDTVPNPEEFTISVEQVRQHFRKRGVHKSKDTVQRWCRNGDLSCQKRGVLNRYFTTEASLKLLEQKILPDMIADTVGEEKRVNNLVQVDAATDTHSQSGMPMYAPEDAGSRTGTKVDATDTAPPHAGSSNSKPETSPELSRVTAENEGLRDQLKSKESEIEFLREEVRTARDHRGAVVQISNRMLETLETMAIGGRLERPRTERREEVVRYRTPQSDDNAV